MEKRPLRCVKCDTVYQSYNYCFSAPTDTSPGAIFTRLESGFEKGCAACGSMLFCIVLDGGFDSEKRMFFPPIDGATANALAKTYNEHLTALRGGAAEGPKHPAPHPEDALNKYRKEYQKAIDDYRAACEEYVEAIRTGKPSDIDAAARLMKQISRDAIRASAAVVTTGRQVKELQGVRG